MTDMPQPSGPWDDRQQGNAPTDPLLAPDEPAHTPLPLPSGDQPYQPYQPAPAEGPPAPVPPMPRSGVHSPHSSKSPNGAAPLIGGERQLLRPTAPIVPPATRQRDGYRNGANGGMGGDGGNGRVYTAPVGQSPAPYGKNRRLRWRRILGISALIAVLLFVLLGGLALHRYADFGNAISQQGPFTTQTNYMTGSGRINLLVLGYGGAGHDGAYLTDSIIVMSLIPGDHATTMISVPRDLWVQVPPNSGNYAKINTAYQDGYENGYNGMPAGRDAGGAEAAEKVSDVLGMPITYWLTMDFQGFRHLVDALGGVDINVPTAFTAQYPVNDDPSINPNWKIIHFNAGPQHMNGEQAIEYARARYVLNPVSEGSDFARSVRQQLLIRAILSRARQPSAWPSLLDATTALQNAIYTNLSLTDLALFSQKLDFTHAAHIGLSDQNVLVDAQSDDGQDILLPANGDWNAIRQYVASNLKN